MHFNALPSTINITITITLPSCEGLGYTAYNTPLEVGCRGVITARNHAVLAMVADMCRIRDVKKLRRTIGKIALVASHRIYLARNSNDWSSGELVKP